MSFDIEYLAVEFVKLQDGQHQFDYQLDKTFFEHFGNHDILNANLLCELDIEKRGNMIVADLFQICARHGIEAFCSFHCRFIVRIGGCNHAQFGQISANCTALKKL